MSQTRPERPARPMSRFAGVTRVGLRVAAVAGFAGVAWLLSSSVADAADAATTTGASTTAGATAAPLTSTLANLVNAVGTGSLSTPSGAPNGGRDTASGSITDAVLQPVKGVPATTTPMLGATSNILSEVLAPADTVLATGHASIKGAAGSTTEYVPRHTAVAPPVRRAPDVAFGAVTTQVATQQPSGPAHVPGSDAGYAGSRDLVRTVTSLVAPLGLTDLVQAPLGTVQPMIGIVDPVLAPLASVLSPVTTSVCHLATPVTATLGMVTRPMTTADLRPTVGSVAGVPAPTVNDGPASAAPAPPALATRVADATETGTTPVRVEPGTPRATVNRTGARVAPPTGRPHTHGVDRRSHPSIPAPPAAPLGSDMGAIPTTGSGSHDDGGAFAVLSSPVVNGSVACRRPVTPTGLSVRRHIAEAPTVSPD